MIMSFTVFLKTFSLDNQIVEETPHLEFDHEETGSCSSDCISVNDEDDYLEDIPTENDDDDYVEESLTENTAGGFEEDNLSKFLFKIKEENKLTKTCVQQIATLSKKLFQGAVSRIKRNVENCLQSDGVECSNIPGFDAVFSDEALEYSDVMLSNLETLHKREDRNMPYVVSKIL